MRNNFIRKFLTGLFILTSFSMLTACSGTTFNTSDNQSGITSTQNPDLKGTVKISGSTTVYPIIDYLKEAYKESRPNVTVNLAQGGSGVGIKDAIDGNNDIGMSSRELKTTETGLKAVAIALDGIAIIINPANGVTDISKDNLKKIFKGEITNWKDIGGVDKTILVITREQGSGTRTAFEEIIGLDKDADGNVNTQIMTGAMVLTDAGQISNNVAGKDNAIGFTTLGAVTSKVKALKVGGIECKTENILNSTYPIGRKLYLVIKDGSQENQPIKDFIAYVLSEEGQKAVTDTGYIKLN